MPVRLGTSPNTDLTRASAGSACALDQTRCRQIQKIAYNGVSWARSKNCPSPCRFSKPIWFTGRAQRDRRVPHRSGYRATRWSVPADSACPFHSHGGGVRRPAARSLSQARTFSLSTPCPSSRSARAASRARSRASSSSCSKIVFGSARQGVHASERANAKFFGVSTLKGFRAGFEQARRHRRRAQRFPRPRRYPHQAHRAAIVAFGHAWTKSLV